MVRARGRRRTGAAVAASILFHLAIVLPLAILIPRLPSPKLARDEPMEVELSRLSPAVESERGRGPAQATQPPVAAPARLSAPDSAQARPDRRNSPSVAAGVQGGGGFGASVAAGAAAPGTDETAGRVRQALRRLGGCEFSGQSSAAELEACRGDHDHQYAVGAAMRVDPMSSDKRAAYDHARDVCDRVYNYSPLDSDPSHTSLPPQVYGSPC